MSAKPLYVLFFNIMLVTLAWAAFTCETVESPNTVGQYNSIFSGSDGNQHISFQDTTNLDLRYCEGKTGSWACQTVDSNNNMGQWSSITYHSDGNLHITHRDATNLDLRYCEGSYGNFACNTIESPNTVGQYNSIFFRF